MSGLCAYSHLCASAGAGHLGRLGTLQLHECRHSFKTFLEDAEIRASRVDRYLGHADHAVQGRYSHQSDAKYLEDAQALDGVPAEGRFAVPRRAGARQSCDSARHAIAV